MNRPKGRDRPPVALTGPRKSPIPLASEGIVDTAVLSRTIWSGLREAIGRGDQEMIRRVRRAVEQCQEEIRGLIT